MSALWAALAGRGPAQHPAHAGEHAMSSSCCSVPETSPEMGGEMPGFPRAPLYSCNSHKTSRPLGLNMEGQPWGLILT